MSACEPPGRPEGECRSSANEGTLLNTALDHLVVAADTLAQGVGWCEATLGVTPQPGGRHARFGTHNRLLKIASAAWPEVYLEIIAIDPEAPPPGRPRWFGLDDTALRARLADGPRLIHAVARSSLLDLHRAGLISAGCRPGDPVRAARETANGRLSWQILVPEDGRLDCGGALPTLIQWDRIHPTADMPDSGVTLQALTLRGVPPAARTVLRLRGVGYEDADNDDRMPALPALSACLVTPAGEVVVLDS